MRDMSVLILENLTKKFKVDKKENVVLDNINLVFPNNGLISIIGKSGSGKSTLLNLLMGIEKPTSGKILYKGKNVGKFNDKKFSRYHIYDISLIFQHYNLFDNLTVFENIILPAQMAGMSKRKYKKKANDLMSDLNIHHLSKRKANKLSGGEKQRVAIARALINDPSVVLCDEPTGALDFKNSQEIMEILKKKSEKLLIIMVSHNMDLVRKYSDSIIELKEGKIADTSLKDETNEESKLAKQNKKYQGNWIVRFLKLNLKHNFVKNIFSVLSCTIGFTAMFLCVGFVMGSEASQNEALMKNLSIGYATVSSVKTIEIEDSPLSFQKTVRPELFEVDSALSEFETISIEENLSYFISSSAQCSFNNKEVTEFEMVPVYDLSLKEYGKDLLKEGTTGSDLFEEVLVNEEFIKLFDGLGVNDEILYSNYSTTSFDTLDKENPFIKDELNIEKPLKIMGILHEFPFLNNPKIYYSYKGARNFLKTQFMENLSAYNGKLISFYDYLVDAKNDDSVTSYSSLIFLKNLDECNKFFEKVNDLKDSNIEITSAALQIKDTYNLFISSFSKTLIVFVAIAFIGINLILGMISLSTYLDNKKNTAILTCLGGHNSSIYKIYLIENYLLIGFSLLLSLFGAKFLEGILNPLISTRFALSNLIAIPFETFLGINYGLILVLILISVIFSTLFSVVPMSIYRNSFITDELRDE